ncbi:MAG: DUF3422 family protein [Aquabacterium sp.]
MLTATQAVTPPPLNALPADDAERAVLHNEVHARPSPRIRLPALVVQVAVLNADVSREAEWAHLRQLPGQADLPFESLQGSFLRLRFADHTFKWERHTEFTRYSLVQTLPEGAADGMDEATLLSHLAVSAEWLRTIPGRTMSAVMLAMVNHPIDDRPAIKERARAWFEGRPVLASMLGTGHSCALTDFALRPSGFERMFVVAPEGTSETRAGRISQRLLEMETYRIMALRGLPVAKALGPMLAEAEAELANITARMEGTDSTDQQLLETLIQLAARVERATAQHMYRFSATQAYNDLVQQRLRELREQAIPGTQTMGEFLQRRLSPAIATVAATAQRLTSLSQRIERTSALLRTRVDIATEAQNQELLAQLTRGQDLQLKLQSTVEGLSIAAISYYVVSLILYIGKAAKAGGAPVNPELLAGALIPLVLLGIWWGTRRLQRNLHQNAPH